MDTAYTVVVPVMDTHVAITLEMTLMVNSFMCTVTAMKHQTNAFIAEVQIEVLDVPGHRLEDINSDEESIH